MRHFLPILVLLSVGIACGQEADKKTTNDETAPEMNNVQQRDITAIVEVVDRVKSVFGEELTPEIKFKVVVPRQPAPGDKKDETEEPAEQDAVSYAFEWEMMKGDDGKETSTVVVTIGRERLYNAQQTAYNLAHIVMSIHSEKLKVPEELAIRDAIALVVAAEGEKIPDLARLIKSKGGPLSMKEIDAFYDVNIDDLKTDEERAERAKKYTEVHAVLYVIGYDWYHRGLLKKFLDGKIDAAALKKEMVPEEAWKRRKDQLIPKKRQPRAIPRGAIVVKVPARLMIS